MFVVLAEMGDKTQLLAMAFAARIRWQTVLWAVFVATLVNHFLAVVAGNVITQFMPIAWIKLVAAASFVLFALWTIRGDTLHGEDRNRGLSPFWTVAIAFFIAEMGDKTQLMTIALAADQAVKVGGTGWLAKAQQIVPVWMGTTTGMIIADSIGILVGIVLHKHIPERLVKWLAAFCFAGFGILGLHDASDELLPSGTVWHHLVLVAVVPLLVAAMWWIGTRVERVVHKHHQA
jgi:putative Ca2+/H+ antiporter (TMEM165/GDT1 family)